MNLRIRFVGLVIVALGALAQPAFAGVSSAGG